MKPSPARKNFQLNDESSDEEDEKFEEDEEKHLEEEEEDYQETEKNSDHPRSPINRYTG